MVFTETELEGAYIIESDVSHDERGFFARMFCSETFEAQGISIPISQSNLSYNGKRGTLRGMHYQLAPHGEAKLITCVGGAVYDVIIDLRPDSPTYTQWTGVELRGPAPDNGTLRTLYVPEGFAHGYQTLEDHTQLFYQMSAPYRPGSARGVRWNDSAFGIRWPAAERIISPRDDSFPDFSREVKPS